MPSNTNHLIATKKPKTDSSRGSDQIRSSFKKEVFMGCLYHESLFQKILGEVNGIRQELSPIERFLQDDALQWHALFFKPDKEELSTRKSCSCVIFGKDLAISDEEND
jgi:hypothetical protein